MLFLQSSISQLSPKIFRRMCEKCPEARLVDVSVCLFVRLSACVSEAPNGSISVKFGVANFYDILLREFKYV